MNTYTDMYAYGRAGGRGEWRSSWSGDWWAHGLEDSTAGTPYHLTHFMSEVHLFTHLKKIYIYKYLYICINLKCFMVITAFVRNHHQPEALKHTV